MYRIPTLLLVFSCLNVARAGDDEVTFKPKSYVPRNTLQDRSYVGSTYSPSSTPKPTGTSLEPSKSGRWSLFSSKSSGLTDKSLTDIREKTGEAYKQEKQISASTIKADSSAVPENKPFDANGKKLTDASYKAPEGPREKDPILKPRQGIKAPE